MASQVKLATDARRKSDSNYVDNFHDLLCLKICEMAEVVVRPTETIQPRRCGRRRHKAPADDKENYYNMYSTTIMYLEERFDTQQLLATNAL